ncbi:hypothetical protein [Halobellus ruber]|uniref:Uncharacterized protein n=1 Tax=Halobellus ruber TaxID=2761102 RepID=A0A7J9SLP2_9EURY|nr:hypothetical protein [Halobellus ruber]MBB6647845.1 hypothetical protein [Halobellus ruber]
MLELITNRESADTAIVTEPSGIGKTYISKLVTKRFREELLNIETTYAGYWRNYTRVLHSLSGSQRSRRGHRHPPVVEII